MTVPFCELVTKDPTVTTAGSSGFTSRLTMVCRRITIEAASTTGSLVSLGKPPCPPIPRTKISKCAAQAIVGPFRMPTVPPGRVGLQCQAKARSGRGNRSYKPSFSIFRAPSPLSSPNWLTITAVPDQWSFNAIRLRTTPTEIAGTMLCPHRWPTLGTVLR